MWSLKNVQMEKDEALIGQTRDSNLHRQRRMRLAIQDNQLAQELGGWVACLHD